MASTKISRSIKPKWKNSITKIVSFKLQNNLHRFPQIAGTPSTNRLQKLPTLNRATTNSHQLSSPIGVNCSARYLSPGCAFCKAKSLINRLSLSLFSLLLHAEIPSAVSRVIPWWLAGSNNFKGRRRRAWLITREPRREAYMLSLLLVFSFISERWCRMRWSFSRRGELKNERRARAAPLLIWDCFLIRDARRLTADLFWIALVCGFVFWVWRGVIVLDRGCRWRL